MVIVYEKKFTGTSMSERRQKTFPLRPARQPHMAGPHTSGAISRLAWRAKMAHAEPEQNQKSKWRGDRSSSPVPSSKSVGVELRRLYGPIVVAQ